MLKRAARRPSSPMRYRLLLIALPVCAILGIGLALTAPASALDCGGVDTSVIGGEACEGASTTSTDSANNPVISVLKFVMQVLMGAVGIAAVGALIYAGIMYSSAGGESSQVQKAKTTIKDTVIGIVAFSFMIIILNFVIPGGVFGQQGVSGGGTVAHTGGGSDDGDDSSPTTFSEISNFRDAATSSGGTLIKPGILYRSANLNTATSDDIAKLSTLLKGGTIFDLRKSSDKKYKKDPSPTGVKNVHIQITGEASAAGYKKTFVNSASDRKKFGETIAAIAKAEGPVLIHCKSGKDRTGWTVAMITYILGDGKYNASDLNAIVMKEYMLSKSEAENRIVEESWLNAGLTEARTKYGSIMKYIKDGLKVSDTTIAALKKKLAS